MRLEGERMISAVPEDIWQRLLMPDMLRACIPGCQTLELTDENAYTATVLIKVGPVKARFNGTVILSDLDRPRSCKLTGQGSGGVAGFAKGEATIELHPLLEGTLLKYGATMQIGGKIASLGDRLFRSVVTNNVNAFFDEVANHLMGIDPASKR